MKKLTFALIGAFMFFTVTCINCFAFSDCSDYYPTLPTVAKSFQSDSYDGSIYIRHNQYYSLTTSDGITQVVAKPAFHQAGGYSDYYYWINSHELLSVSRGQTFSFFGTKYIFRDDVDNTQIYILNSDGTISDKYLMISSDTDDTWYFIPVVFPYNNSYYVNLCYISGDYLKRSLERSLTYPHFIQLGSFNNALTLGTNNIDRWEFSPYVDFSTASVNDFRAQTFVLSDTTDSPSGGSTGSDTSDSTSGGSTGSDTSDSTSGGSTGSDTSDSTSGGSTGSDTSDSPSNAFDFATAPDTVKGSIDFVNSSGDSLSDFWNTVFSFLPGEILALLAACVVLIIIIGVVKVLWF